MIDSFSILFSWSTPDIPNGEIVSYTITFNKTELPTTVNVLNTTQHLVTELNAYTFYEVTISASTVVGEGPATPPLVVRTDISSNTIMLFMSILVMMLFVLHAVPSAPPLNFTASVNGTTSVLFNWQPPSLDDRNGILSYYQLRLVDQSFNLTDLMFNTTNTNFNIDTLEEYIRYSCFVAAATDVGLGPYTDPIEITTLQDCKSKLRFRFMFYATQLFH